MANMSAAARRGFNAMALDEETQFIEDLRGMIWKDSQDRRRSWKAIAEDAGVNVATVAKFADGTTKRPQVPTLRRLGRACGYRMTFVSIGVHTLGEIDLKSLRKVKRY